MGRPRYLVLHKTEWERIKRQSGPPEEPDQSKEEYLKALTEKSQEWIKTWPDTVAGHMAQLEKQKAKQRKDNIAFIKAYTKKKREDHTVEAIKNARQMIFEDSSYGKKLIGALIESKTLEERDAQIIFQKEMKQKEAELEKQNKSNVHGVFDLGHEYGHETDAEKKQKALECIRINKEIESMKQENKSKEEEKEKKCQMEGEKLMEQLLESEAKKREEIKHLEKQALEEYETEHKKVEKLRAENKANDDALTELYKKEQDRIKCKMQEAFKRIYQGKQESKRSKDLYEMIDKIQKEEKKRYDDFIEKQNKKCEESNSTRERKEIELQKEKQSNQYLVSQKNKIAAEIARKEGDGCADKCVCDRQSLITKSKKQALKSLIDYKEEKDKLGFLKASNKLMEELNQRKQEPSPWNASKGAHAQFAQQADAILQECKYKNVARKVVDEYRRFNCLDSASLPIPNY